MNADPRNANLGNANLPIGADINVNQEIGVPARCGMPAAEPVWHREYGDRYMRDENHFNQCVEDIHQNPVKAGLFEGARAWPWSSAFPARSMAANSLVPALAACYG
jgi:hypothetical protein